jgi:hypothetical protein
VATSTLTVPAGKQTNFIQRNKLQTWASGVLLSSSETPSAIRGNCCHRSQRCRQTHPLPNIHNAASARAFIGGHKGSISIVFSYLGDRYIT